MVLKKKSLLKVVVTVSILLLAILMIKPVLTSYNVYRQIEKSNYSVEDYGSDIQELKSNLLVSNTNLSSCHAFNKELLTEIGTFSEKFSECKSELGALTSDFNLSEKMYEEKIETCEERIESLEVNFDEKNDEMTKLKTEKEEEIEDWKTRYELLAQNLANNLCCKAKIDNPHIGYFKVDNNKIVCLEEGDSSISCDF